MVNSEFLNGLRIEQAKIKSHHRDRKTKNWKKKNYF